jgi:fatty acid desaturase
VIINTAQVGRKGCGRRPEFAQLTRGEATCSGEVKRHSRAGRVLGYKGRVGTETETDHRALLASLSPVQRRMLCARADGPAALRLALHLGGIAAGGLWIAAGLPFWWAAMLPQGVLLAFLFTALHETIHGTAFRTGWLNARAADLLGFLVLLGPRHFRYFHLAHHRFTHDPEHDPELAGGPKPGTLPEYLVYLSGVPDWRWRIGTLIANATRPNRQPFVPPRGRAAVRREARAMLGLYAGLILLSLGAGSAVMLWIWVLPLALGAPFLRGYLLAEHGRCPHVADMLKNSRTTATTLAVRWLAWNMPYHAEHHAYPAVPFHKLPALHELARGHVPAERGYAWFNGAYARDAAAGALPQTPGRG